MLSVYFSENGQFRFAVSISAEKREAAATVS
jgi:phosphopantetheinyl transferase (holo-ACP synthase)